MDAAPAAVLFDYGGTLVSFERPEASLAAAYARIADHLRDLGFASPAWPVLLRDVHDRVEAAFLAHQRTGALREIDLVATAAHAYSDLGVELPPELLDDVLRMEQEGWWDGVRLAPDAVPVLTALRGAGVRLGLCSNAPYRVQSLHAQLEHVGIAHLFDTITFSGAVGWRKPSPRIFVAALEALGVAPHDAAMIGDSPREDIAGAQAVGVRTVLLDADGARRQHGEISANATIARLRDLLTVWDWNLRI